MIKATHGYSIRHEAKDGTIREQGLTRLSNGGFVIDFYMLLPGQEVPVKTELPITAEGFSMLSSLIAEVHNIDQYPLLERSDD